MKVAKAKGRLRGKQPKLISAPEAHLVKLWRDGTRTSAELAELFFGARSTVYRPRRATRGGAEPWPDTDSVSGHVFVDESKDRDYLLVASIHVSGELGDLRELIRGLVLPGQRRVHMTKESDPRRRAIAAAICGARVGPPSMTPGTDTGANSTPGPLARVASSRTSGAGKTPCSCSSKTTRCWTGTAAGCTR